MFLTAEQSLQPMDFPVLKLFLLVLVLISGPYKFLGSFYTNALSHIHFANIFSLRVALHLVCCFIGWAEHLV